MAVNDAPEAKAPASPVKRHHAEPPQNEKERRLPSVTPGRFRKFFTPRQSAHYPSAASRALRDVTNRPTLNHRLETPSSPLKPASESSDLENTSSRRGRHLDEHLRSFDSVSRNDKNPVSCLFDLEDAISFDTTPRRNKRRKTGHYTPPESSPIKEPALIQTSPSVHSTRTQARSALLSPMGSLASSHMTETEDISDIEYDDLDGHEPLERLMPLTHRSNGIAAQLVQRQLGDTPRAGRSFISCPASDWRSETADFSTTPADVHMCSSHEGAARCIPFCAAACHTNSLVAVGDEEGRVRLLDSTTSEQFDKIYVSFQAHSNAIIDLDFSENDLLLATASGDQTGKVFDMMTQTPVAVFGHHTASLKQIRFQPGGGKGSVLATCSRDGSVLIWDLRCGGKPVQDILMERESSLGFRLPTRELSNADRLKNIIKDAHLVTKRQTRSQTKATPHPDVARQGEVPGRLGEVSVTAIQYLPAGREHLLLSACEADASIKVWDTRCIKASSPVSYTAPMSLHTSWRPFGISSLSMSTDGARLYALCKDNTVYAYSTANLALGKAPELSSFKSGKEPITGNEPLRRTKASLAQEGPGPMYGFRHPNLHATSFYVKSAIRSAADGRPELLAVGSADGCAVLFPTDERYFKYELESGRHAENNTDATFTTSFSSSQGGSRPNTAASARRGGPGLFRTNSGTNLAARLLGETIPIIKNVGGAAGAGNSWGTPLVRGHEREVGAVTWTSEGKLVTVGDDYMIRCWSEEDRSKAYDLRTGGETEGRRWGCGWAEVGEDWDEDEW